MPAVTDVAFCWFGHLYALEKRLKRIRFWLVLATEQKTLRTYLFALDALAYLYKKLYLYSHFTYIDKWYFFLTNKQEQNPQHNTPINTDEVVTNVLWLVINFF